MYYNTAILVQCALGFTSYTFHRSKAELVLYLKMHVCMFFLFILY